MNTIKIKKGKTKMIAHRGLSGLEKENSLRAFVAAANRHYYGSECDIHYTKDNKLVVCHDDYTNRVSNYDYIIPNTSFEELEKVRLNEFNKDEEGRDLVIPTYEEYLEIQRKYNKHAIVEIKCEINEENAKEILELSKNNKVTFISFNLNNLIILRKENNKIPLMLLQSKFDENMINTLIKYNLGIDILYKELTKERIDLYHAHNIIVNAWTINDKDVALKLIDWGIDFITTNILE